MLHPLTRQNLHGVWCALILPWTADDQLDAKQFCNEIHAYANTGVHGLYTGGTTGEFYAQDDATFEQVTKIACEQTHAIGLPVQIGCTALSTRTVRQRIGIAKHAGADAIQIALPFWLELKDDEVFQFLKDLAAAAQATPIVLYLTARAKRSITPDFMAQIAAEVPALIGTKDLGSPIETLKDFVAKTDLAIFGGEHDFLERIPAGGQGGYCAITGLNARRIVEYYHHCAEARFDQAKIICDEVTAMRQIFLRWVHEDGLWDSAIDRVQRMVGGIDIGLRCQPPYRSASQKHVDELRDWCLKNAPKFLEHRATQPR